MKTFQLTRLSEHKGNYHVFLTWGKSYEFTQHRHAAKFLTTTNRFLTAFLVELNDTYCDLEVRYRKNWLLFYHNKKTHGPDNYSDDRFCDNRLTDVKQLMNIAFNQHQFPNGSSYTFENFRKSNEFLSDVCKVLRRYYRRRSETVDVWQVDLLISKLQARKAELESWGIESSVKMNAKLHVAFQQVIPLQFTHKISSL